MNPELLYKELSCAYGDQMIRKEILDNDIANTRKQLAECLNLMQEEAKRKAQEEPEKEKYKEIYDAEIASGKDKLTAAQNAVTKYNEWVAKENKGELDSLEKQADAVLKIEQAKDKQWLGWSDA